MAVFNNTVLPLPAAPRNHSRFAFTHVERNIGRRSFRAIEETVTCLEAQQTCPFRRTIRTRPGCYEDFGDEADPARRPVPTPTPRLRSRAAHALGAAGGAQTVEAADQRDREGEYEGLEQALSLTSFHSSACQVPTSSTAAAGRLRKALARHHPAAEHSHKVVDDRQQRAA